MRSSQCVRIADRFVVTRFTSCLLPALMLATLAGCQPPPAPPVARPADEETLRSVRQSFTAVDPKTMVGLVTAVLPSDMYAAVGGLPVQEFQVGEPISFIDTNKKLLVNGIVKKITADTLHVQYELPGPDTRAPRVGDLAIRFKP